jgi:hypothetical protein
MSDNGPPQPLIDGASILAIYDDLTQFVSQRKWPVNAVLISKLKELHAAVGLAMGIAPSSPLRRSTDFGKRANPSQRTNDDSTGSPSMPPPASNSNPAASFFLDVEDDPPGEQLTEFIESKRPSSAKRPQLELVVSETPAHNLQRTFTQTEVQEAVKQAIEANKKQEQSVHANKQENCVILSDSSFRLISGFLPATTNTATKTTTSFTAYPIGGATISQLYVALHEGTIPITKADHLIIHCGVNDVGAHDRPNPATLSREYSRLIAKAKERFPGAKITMSHIFPMKTGSMELRRAVQTANTAMDAAASQSRGVKCVAFGDRLLWGSVLRAHFYENQRHLNVNGARFVSFRVREHFGFTTKPRRPLVPPAAVRQANSFRPNYNRTQTPQRSFGHANQIFRAAPWHHNRGPSGKEGPENRASVGLNTHFQNRPQTQAPITGHLANENNNLTSALKSMLTDFNSKLVDLFVQCQGRA